MTVKDDRSDCLGLHGYRGITYWDGVRSFKEFPVGGWTGRGSNSSIVSGKIVELPTVTSPPFEPPLYKEGRGPSNLPDSGPRRYHCCRDSRQGRFEVYRSKPEDVSSPKRVHVPRTLFHCKHVSVQKTLLVGRRDGYPISPELRRRDGGRWREQRV